MDMVLRVFVLAIASLVGAYVACRGAYRERVVEVLLGSDALAACMASMVHAAFGLPLEGCLVMFALLFVAFATLVHRLLSPLEPGHAD